MVFEESFRDASTAKETEQVALRRTKCWDAVNQLPHKVRGPMVGLVAHCSVLLILSAESLILRRYTIVANGLAEELAVWTTTLAQKERLRLAFQKSRQKSRRRVDFTP